MGHLRLVHGLRAVAALLVLVSHVGFWTGATGLDLVGGLIARGDAGVAVFFAISAFLLLRPMVRRTLAHQEPIRPGSRYWAHRAGRILPAYWLTLLAVVVAAATLSSAGGVGGMKKVLAHVFLLQGYTQDFYQSFTQTWSLTTEVTFYLLVPVIGAVVVRRFGRRDAERATSELLAWLGVSVVAGVCTQALAHLWAQSGSTQGAAVLATSVLGHCAWFAAGLVVAVLIEARQAGVGPLSRPSAFTAVFDSRATLVLLAVFVFALASSPLAGPRDLSSPTLAEAAFKEAAYTLFALLLLASAATEPRAESLAESLAGAPVVAWLGNISYGIFLWHVLVLQLVFAATGSALFATGFWWVLYAVVGFTLAIASLSWLLLERPTMTWVRCQTDHATAAKR